MLAGAVALAAGRFQPLVRLEPIAWEVGHEDSRPGSRMKRFHDVLSMAEARRFARLIEATALSLAGGIIGLGDRCDFLTLAGDWPYRYLNNQEGGVASGEHALDDLVGRIIPTDQVGVEQSRSRWAFAGRLLGDPAASVYRAMCSLFLQPESALLWNTYQAGPNWSDYRMTEAAATLAHLWPQSQPPLHRSGLDANLSAWHQALDPVNRFGWFMVNSTGSPRQFSIFGGSGNPADLPRGRPSVVSIIHSFSAADPIDPSTIAGRWLENGAFVYFGSMNEPFLSAFRCPKLVAELATGGMPLSAVLRLGVYEPLGRPWRLVYLGDPLYQFRRGGSHSLPPRIAPALGQSEARIAGNWSCREITAKHESLDPGADSSTRLRWCLTAAISDLCQNDDSVPSRGTPVPPPRESRDWRSILQTIARESVNLPLRPILDELMSDALLNSGNLDQLLEWLMRIPPAECSPRNCRLIETVAMSWLANIHAGRSITPALDLWDEVIRRPWPGGQEFSAEFTHRLGALVDACPPSAHERFRLRLVEARRFLSLNSQHSPSVELVNEELKRLDAAARRESVQFPH
jgi:hypothetical protein